MNNAAPARAIAQGVDERRAGSGLRRQAEYWAAKGALDFLGALPRGFARPVCAVLAALCFWFWPRLRRIGLWNLRLAYPRWNERQRRRTLWRSFQNLGRMLADFAYFPHLNRGDIDRLIVYDGFEHYENARRQGKGVLFLTAHFGAWELGSFAHGVHGHPVNFVARKLDNPRVDALITRYRCLSGAKPIDKAEFARGALRALKQNDAVGILMDQNMMPAEGIFVDFFGRPASTAVSPARIAQKTGAAIVLGLVIWDTQLGKHRLTFEPVEWITRSDPAEEAAVNTANFARILERRIREHPDQWLWMHRRWKTRPPGEAPLYPF